MSTAPLLFAAAAAVGGGSGGWSCSFHNFCVLWGGAFLKNEFISIYLFHKFYFSTQHRQQKNIHDGEAWSRR